MKSEKDGVKHYSKGVKVNARRKSALKRLEIALNNCDKDIKSGNHSDEAILKFMKDCERMNKEIQTLKERIY